MNQSHMDMSVPVCESVYLVRAYVHALARLDGSQMIT